METPKMTRKRYDRHVKDGAYFCVYCRAVTVHADQRIDGDRYRCPECDDKGLWPVEEAYEARYFEVTP